jgi:hypothetical protein
MAPHPRTKPRAKKAASPAKRSAAKKDKANRGARELHRELSPVILDRLAANFLAETDDTWAKVAACVRKQLPSGPTALPSRDTKQVWSDKSNSIACCVKKLPNYSGVTQQELASFLNRLWDKNKDRNAIIYELYKKRDKGS